MKLYVKKIWSYNPNKYKYITIEKAQKGYDEYLDYFLGSPFFNKNKRPKNFETWLRTEV